ncbi:family 31 glycoside hydrolase [Xylariales sp. AK1849]|nr:family 31 glycoside hydrolase [Xylariales sp. AK1849]
MGDLFAVKQNGIVGGVGSQRYRFTLLADGLIRYEWAPDCIFENRPSAFAAHRTEPNTTVPGHVVKETHDTLEISTCRFQLTYDKRPFSPHGLFVLVHGHTRSLWRYGEESETLGGTTRTLDGVDGRTEVGQGIVSRQGFASVDDSDTMLFEKDGFIAARRPGLGRVDGYLFAYGHDYRGAVKALYRVSGPTPLLPRWALGNWWSRNYVYTAGSYLSLMDQFREHGVPLSVAVLDMDWHLVDDPRVVKAGQTGWTGYTWNKKLFPDPPAFLNELHKRKLKTTLNDHPADGVHSYEDLYTEVAKAVGRDPATKQPIPFNVTDRDYLRSYLDILIRSLEKDGCDFIWMDYQQGRYSRLAGVDPLWVLNHYHFLHNARWHEDHPIIFSRYAGPGSHRYPIGFSGDTIVSWKSLDFQPEFTATASNIGYGWWSHDIGGHMMGFKDDELFTRWVQLGVLSPIMRLHSTKSRWVAKEPWKLPDPYRDILTVFLRLRHRLIPYLHTMNARAAMEGEPLVQPVYWAYPEHDEAYLYKKQYFFGSELLVVPITTPEDRNLKLSKVKAWLPPGRYVDFFSGVVYEGDRELWLSRPLDQYPIFMKEGSIVVLEQELEPENGGENPSGFEVVVAIGDNGNHEILEEEGNESTNLQWLRTPVRFLHTSGSLHIGPAHGYAKGAVGRSDRAWCLTFLGFTNTRLIGVTVDGVHHQYRSRLRRNRLVVDIGLVPSSSEIVVEIGANPQFRPTDPKALIEPILDAAQIAYDLKEAIWAIVGDARHPYVSELGRLQALDMTNNLRLAISEFFTCDWRRP